MSPTMAYRPLRYKTWGTHSCVTTRKKVKPIHNSVAHDHLLHCNYLLSCDNFSIMACENKNFLLEIKISLLIMRDKS